MMKRLGAFLGVCAIAALGVQAAPAAADPTAGPAICSSAGTAISGNHAGLVVTGNMYVPAGATLNVFGNLVLTPGSCFDAFTVATVNVLGNVFVTTGATLALGCSPTAIGNAPPCGSTTTHDVVAGSVIALAANTMYLTADEIHGSMISIGGGPGVTTSPWVNFAIKDNTVSGDMYVAGWKGAWLGVLRNTVAGSMLIAGNGGADVDSTEIATNTVTRDLVCFGNQPVAQIGDSGGLANVVGGAKLGECAGL